MKVNCEKIGVIDFGNNNPEIVYSFYGKPIPVWSTYKDSGIFIDSHLVFDVHAVNLAKKSSVIYLALSKIYLQEE